MTVLAPAQVVGKEIELGDLLPSVASHGHANDRLRRIISHKQPAAVARGFNAIAALDFVDRGPAVTRRPNSDPKAGQRHAPAGQRDQAVWKYFLRRANTAAPSARQSLSTNGDIN